MADVAVRCVDGTYLEVSQEVADGMAQLQQAKRDLTAAVLPIAEDETWGYRWQEWVGMLVEVMQDQGARRADVVATLLWEAGCIVGHVDAAAPDATAVRSAISEFSNHCADLVTPPSTAGRLDRH